MRRFFLSFLFLSFIVVSINCSKDVTKNNNNQILAQPNKVPPGHAEITGEIVEIEPIGNNVDQNDPCSKAPCMAKVKVNSISYGAGFPTININQVITIKFAFTLSKTNKELFPNMDESYPGLEKGSEFTGLVAHFETINESAPSFLIYGYSVK